MERKRQEEGRYAVMDGFPLYLPKNIASLGMYLFTYCITVYHYGVKAEAAPGGRRQRKIGVRGVRIAIRHTQGGKK